MVLVVFELDMEKCKVFQKCKNGLEERKVSVMRASQGRNKSPGLKLGQEGLEIVAIQSSVAHVIRK